MSIDPFDQEVRDFVTWCQQNQVTIINNMVATQRSSCADNAQITITDHLDSISVLGIHLCASRVRDLISQTADIDEAPTPSDQAVKWLYDSPQGRRAQYIFDND